MDTINLLGAVLADPKRIPQYKAVCVRDEGFYRLFVFHCHGQDESQIAGGLLSIHLEYWDNDITLAGQSLLERGSARFGCNSPIVADWQEDAGQYDHVPDKEQYVLNYLETLWRMLSDTAIVDTRYFCWEGGVA